jgi:hypothetical protein
MRFARNAAGNRRLRLAIALLGAVALLLGQLAASVHTHASFASEHAVTQLSAGDVLCPLCLLAFHSTPEPSAAPAIHCPQVCREVVADMAAAFVESPVFARAMTRAPPALA